MSQQVDDVQNDASKIPSVSIQPVGNPAPIKVGNTNLEKPEPATSGRNTPDILNGSNAVDKQ